MTKIAILADVHFHDVYGDYDFDGPEISSAARRVSARTLRDSVNSTRIFNENYFAFLAVLDDLVARDIRHVVLVGDYSDDGQRATLDGLKKVLDRYRAQYGMAFYATVGNHDVRTPVGKNHDKRFLNGDGSHTLVTSSHVMKSSGPQIVTDKMFGLGYGDAVLAMAEAGFFRRPQFLHWETPFGEIDDLATRTFEIRSRDGANVRRTIDASYLVEPFEGLWLVSIDSNVYVPKNGDFPPHEPKGYVESSDAGWNAVLEHKAFIFDWLADVQKRARSLGKKLLVFSHYPVVDFLRGTVAAEEKLLGSTGFARRSPSPAASDAFARTGIGLHFSGHLHVNVVSVHESEHGRLINVAVPSLAGYPPAYKIVTLDDADIKIETVVVRDVPNFDTFFNLYRSELTATAERPSSVLEARDYYAFVRAHMSELVSHRYLTKEWPHDLLPLIARLTGSDLLFLAAIDEPLDAADVLAAIEDRIRDAPDALQRVTFKDMVVDWYRLRHASDLAFADIGAERIATYRQIIDRFARHRGSAGVQGRLALFADIMRAYLDGLSAKHMKVDWVDGQIRTFETPVHADFTERSVA